MARLVTGIKPTGDLHLGNYLGMIRPTLVLAAEHDTYLFVADLHALNTGPDPADLRRHSLQVAAALLALGLDPARSTLYRQSDVPEVCELACLLASVTAKGLLNRAHAYKAAVEANRAHGRSPDDGVNLGLYTYPLLMAADILAPAGTLVPIGADQRQHLEITRDIATACNVRFGPLLPVPEGVMDDRARIVAGTDGRKMSKSYGNTIPILEPPDRLRRAVMGIVTDSRPVAAPKDPDADIVFRLFELVAPPDRTAELRQHYLAGGMGYGSAKQALVEVLEDHFGAARRRYRRLLDAPHRVVEVLDAGARRVRPLAAATVAAVRDAAGMPPLPALRSPARQGPARHAAGPPAAHP